MTRRAFFAAFAAAIAGIDAPRAIASAPEPDYTMAGFLRVGDVLTFGADPTEYVVTAVYPEAIAYSRVWSHGYETAGLLGAHRAGELPRRVGRVVGSRVG